MAKEIRQPKSFWQRKEGRVGAFFLAGIVIGLGTLIGVNIGTILASTALLTVVGVLLGVLVWMAVDPKARNLIWYMYKSLMRSITGIFVNLDPIAILKNYVKELESNLRKMNKQVSMLRGQMHKLAEIIHNNKQDIQSNLELASKAKASNKREVMILKSRKAGRLRESNVKLEDLYKKMEVLYRVLTKMYGNSRILKEDIKDQVKIKEVERKAIHASHGAMKSAMSVMSGDPDKRAMFDMAMEAVAEDVGNKVGEMERFMDMSSSFMESVDLQNGIFEEEGLQMLEKWEAESDSLILGDDKELLLLEAEDDNNVLDLNQPMPEMVRDEAHRNQYDSFFD